MPAIANQIKASFAGKKVAVIGDIVADQFLNGTISRVLREAPVFILKHNATETRPGGAAKRCSKCCFAGKDDAGERLIKSLIGSGVSVEYVVRDPALATTTKLRVLAGQPYAIRQQVIRIA